MKIVQSFWSKPLLDNEGIMLKKETSWYNKRMFYQGLALSATLMHKYHSGNTILVTDVFGKKLLVDYLQLPYDKVIVELDKLNKYNSGLWALGKIYTYSIMNEPFIHIDFDYFLANKFEQSVIEAPLVAYVNDIIKVNNGYGLMLDNYLEKLNVSNKVKRFIHNRYQEAHNAGVLGGTELNIFKELWEIVTDTIARNEILIEQHMNSHRATIAGYNVILEQYFFSCLANESKIDVVCLEKSELINENKALFPATTLKYYPQKNIHLLNNKSSVIEAIFLEQILLVENFDSFLRIDDLIKANII